MTTPDLHAPLGALVRGLGGGRVAKATFSQFGKTVSIQTAVSRSLYREQSFLPAGLTEQRSKRLTSGDPAETLEGAMTVQELARLITSYRWLSEELAAQPKVGAEHNRAHIREKMERLFLEIVQHPTDNPHISCVQIDFLVSAMGEAGQDDEARALLCDMTLTHLRRLSTLLGKRARGSRPRRKRTSRATSSILGRYPIRTGSA